MRLTMVRHGETASNVTGRLDSSEPGAPLSDQGLAQATAVARRLQGQPFDGIWASTMIRTQMTATPIAADLGLDIEIRRGLAEFDMGLLQGRVDQEALDIFYSTWRSWLLGDLERRLPGGESGQEVLRRVDTVVDEIRRSGQQTPLIASHGGTLRTWAAHRAHNVTSELALSHFLVNTGVIVLTEQDGGWFCETWDRPPDGPHVHRFEPTPDPASAKL